MARLTEKQKRFVDEYLIDLNATQAAIRAGYSGKTAGRIAIELLNKTHISDLVRERMINRGKRTEITQDRVLQELASIGFADISDYASVISSGLLATVRLTPTADIPQEKRAAIAGIKEGANGVEVKLNDKVKALELIGRHLGMYTDKVDLTGGINIIIEDDYGDERDPNDTT